MGTSWSVEHRDAVTRQTIAFQLNLFLRQSDVLDVLLSWASCFVLRPGGSHNRPGGAIGNFLFRTRRGTPPQAAGRDTRQREQAAWRKEVTGNNVVLTRPRTCPVPSLRLCSLQILYLCDRHRFSR